MTSSPSSPGPGDPTKEAATMVEIVAVLSETYLDDGVAIWLGAWHAALHGRPVDLCRTAEGRAAVFQMAESLTGMVAT